MEDNRPEALVPTPDFPLCFLSSPVYSLSRPVLVLILSWDSDLFTYLQLTVNLTA